MDEGLGALVREKWAPLWAEGLKIATPVPTQPVKAVKADVRTDIVAVSGPFGPEAPLACFPVNMSNAPLRRDTSLQPDRGRS